MHIGLIIDDSSINSVGGVEGDCGRWTDRRIANSNVEPPWRSGNVMNCHATAPGSIPGRDGVFTELPVLRKGQ